MTYHPVECTITYHPVECTITYHPVEKLVSCGILKFSFKLEMGEMLNTGMNDLHWT